MPANFVNIDRDTDMLMPLSLRELVPRDSPVHLILDVCRRVPMCNFKVNHRGSGSPQMPPRTMLALLIYSYATGTPSSRAIERSTRDSLTVHYLMGGHSVDHSVICAFRKDNKQAIEAAFIQTLKVARELGLLRVGNVAIDGTHLKADASLKRNLTLAAAQKRRDKLDQNIKDLLAEIEEADRLAERGAGDGDDDGGGGGGGADPTRAKLEELNKARALKAEVDEAVQRLHDEASAKAEANERGKDERHAEKLAVWEQENRQEAAGELKKEDRKQKRKPVRGRKGVDPEDAVPDEKATTNLTDPDSAVMRKTPAKGIKQGYNGQAATDADGTMLILATGLLACSSDTGQLLEMLEAAAANLSTAGYGDQKPRAVLGDSGYCKGSDIEAVEAMGVEALVAVPPTRPGTELKQQTLIDLKQKMETDERARSVYALRQQSVEPVFGTMKSTMSCERILRRGLEGARGEWNLNALAFNCRRLNRLVLDSKKAA